MSRAHFNIPSHLGVRTKRYKLIYFYDSPLGPDGKTPVNGARPNVRDPFWELYDLDEDPLELRNVYHEAEYQDRVRTLTRRLVELRELYEDDRDGLDLGL